MVWYLGWRDSNPQLMELRRLFIAAIGTFPMLVTNPHPHALPLSYSRLCLGVVQERLDALCQDILLFLKCGDALLDEFHLVLFVVGLGLLKV